MNGRPQRLLIMAGGTGGHVFPALAVAHYLREQGVEVYWLGTRQGLEARVVTEAGLPLEFISISGLRGKGWLSWLIAPGRLLLALWQALRVCHQCKPDAALGMGGFVSGPGGLACWLLRKPLLIHEQNAIPGLTNRLLRHLARRVMQAFPGSFAGNHKLMHTGNPLRGEILALEEPAQRYARHAGPLRILVVGGSLGALALNQQVPAALSLLRGEYDFEVWHQTGKGKLDATDEIYARAGIAARTEMFIEDMATAYAWADLVICRAGALTVSELAVAGVASILIPYPHAADNHQLANAAQLQQAGAALVLTQDRLSPAALADILRDLFDKGRSQLLDMAQQARKAAMPQATETVARACLEVMHG